MLERRSKNTDENRTGYLCPVSLSHLYDFSKHSYNALVSDIALFFRYFLVTIVMINHEIHNEDLTSVYV